MGNRLATGLSFFASDVDSVAAAGFTRRRQGNINSDDSSEHRMQTGYVGDDGLDGSNRTMTETNVILPPSSEDVQQVLLALDRMELEIGVLRERLGARSGMEARRPRRRDRKANPVLRPWMTDNILLISCLWQIINVLVLISYEGPKSTREKDQVEFDASVFVLMAFQIIHLLFIIVVSVKLGKQVLHHTASGWFVVQSYLSTLLLFAGLYTMMYRISANSFNGIDISESNGTKELGASRNTPGLFFRFLYFSATVMSTVGFGDTQPVLWYASATVLIQMMISVVYSTVIFSKALSLFNDFSRQDSDGVE